jgi:hypothetical protein
MCRIFHVLLTTSALLACPLHCMDTTHDLRVHADPVQTGSCCAHCAAERDGLPRGVEPPVSPAGDDGQEAPAPCQDCRCGDCLCRGATLGDDDVLPDASDNPVAPPVALTAGDVLAPAAIRRPAADKSPPGQQPASGRAARVLLQSFLL